MAADSTHEPAPDGVPERESAAGRLPAPDAAGHPAPHEEPPFDPFAPPDATGRPSVPDPVPEPVAYVRSPNRFRAWTAGRPFVGGLLMTLGGLEILATEYASLGVVVHVGMEGLAGYVIPAMLVVCGLLVIFNPLQRIFYAVLGVLLALGTWITSNLGGFFVGLLLGLLGSCLAFGWLPDQEPRRKLLRRARTGQPGGDAARS